MSEKELQPVVIHCIGDSHTSLFGGREAIQPTWPEPSGDILPLFKTYHLGGALAYNLKSETSATGGGVRLFDALSTIPPCSHVLLSFGEIDCRAHLIKQSARQKRPLAAIVNDCLDCYFEVVARVRDSGFHVIVYNSVPSRTSTPRRNSGEGNYAAAGSWRERNRAVRLYNEGAARRCADLGVRFLETYPHLLDRHGKTVTWYYFDKIHLSQRAMPLTLAALAGLFPEWKLSVPSLSRPNSLELACDRIVRRTLQIAKELGKIRRYMNPGKDTGVH